MDKRKEMFRVDYVWRLLFAGAALISGGTAAHSGDGFVSDTRVQCDIEVREERNMLRMRGVVLADDALQGVYEFEVRSLGGSNSTSIHQSGQFSAGSGEPEYFGLAQFGGTGASYNAKLTLYFDAEELVCNKRIDQGKEVSEKRI